MPYTDSQGAEVWYEDEGAGPAVLLVHGGLFDPADGAMFWTRPGVTADLAAAGYRVLVPDRRYGAGRTRAPFGTHSWAVEAADLAAVLAHAGVSAAHVVAGSNGCSAAVRLALNVPQTVRSLVLCWPVEPADRALWDAFVGASAFVAERGPAAYLEELRAAGAPRAGDPRAGWPWRVALLRDGDFAAQFISQGADTVAAVMRDTAAALLPGDLLRGLWMDEAAALGRLEQVTIVPSEPENRVHPRAAALRLVAAVPGARLENGFPESPTPHFAAARAAYAACVRRLLAEEGGP